MTDEDLRRELLDTAVYHLTQKFDANQDGRDEDAAFHDRQADQAILGLSSLETDDREVIA